MTEAKSSRHVDEQEGDGVKGKSCNMEACFAPGKQKTSPSVRRLPGKRERKRFFVRELTEEETKQGAAIAKPLFTIQGSPEAQLLTTDSRFVTADGHIARSDGESIEDASLRPGTSSGSSDGSETSWDAGAVVGPVQAVGSAESQQKRPAESTTVIVHHSSPPVGEGDQVERASGEAKVPPVKIEKRGRFTIVEIDAAVGSSPPDLKQIEALIAGGQAVEVAEDRSKASQEKASGKKNEFYSAKHLSSSSRRQSGSKNIVRLSGQSLDRLPPLQGADTCARGAEEAGEVLAVTADIAHATRRFSTGQLDSEVAMGPTRARQLSAPTRMSTGSVAMPREGFAAWRTTGTSTTPAIITTTARVTSASLPGGELATPSTIASASAPSASAIVVPPASDIQKYVPCGTLGFRQAGGSGKKDVADSLSESTAALSTVSTRPSGASWSAAAVASQVEPRGLPTGTPRLQPKLSRSTPSLPPHAPTRPGDGQVGIKAVPAPVLGHSVDGWRGGSGSRPPLRHSTGEHPLRPGQGLRARRGTDATAQQQVHGSVGLGAGKSEAMGAPVPSAREPSLERSAPTTQHYETRPTEAEEMRQAPAIQVNPWYLQQMIEQQAHTNALMMEFLKLQRRSSLGQDTFVPEASLGDSRLDERLAKAEEDKRVLSESMCALRSQVDKLMQINRDLREKNRVLTTLQKEYEVEIRNQAKEVSNLTEVNRELRERSIRNERKYMEEKEHSRGLERQLSKQQTDRDKNRAQSTLEGREKRGGEGSSGGGSLRLRVGEAQTVQKLEPELQAREDRAAGAAGAGRVQGGRGGGGSGGKRGGRESGERDGVEKGGGGGKGGSEGGGGRGNAPIQKAERGLPSTTRSYEATRGGEMQTEFVVRPSEVQERLASSNGEELNGADRSKIVNDRAVNSSKVGAERVKTRSDNVEDGHDENKSLSRQPTSTTIPASTMQQWHKRNIDKTSGNNHNHNHNNNRLNNHQNTNNNCNNKNNNNKNNNNNNNDNNDNDNNNDNNNDDGKHRNNSVNSMSNSISSSGATTRSNNSDKRDSRAQKNVRGPWGKVIEKDASLKVGKVGDSPVVRRDTSEMFAQSTGLDIDQEVGCGGSDKGASVAVELDGDSALSLQKAPVAAAHGEDPPTFISGT